MGINIRLHQENTSTVDFVPLVDVHGGDVIQYDDEGHVGIATYDIKAGNTGSLRVKGQFVGHLKSGVSIGTGACVYYNATLDRLTNDSSDIFMGYRVPWNQPVPADPAWIAFELIQQGTGNSPAAAVAGNVKDLTDSTGGTASESGALVAPASTDYSTAELKANFATIAAKLKEVNDSLKEAGIMEEDAETSDVSA